MGTKEENAASRDVKIVNIETQLKAWSTRLDELVVSYLGANSQSTDAYRVRLDALRTRHGAVQAKLNEFNSQPANGRSWTSFWTPIKDDWKALESGFDDLTR